MVITAVRYFVIFQKIFFQKSLMGSGTRVSFVNLKYKEISGPIFEWFINV